MTNGIGGCYLLQSSQVISSHLAMNPDVGHAWEADRQLFRNQVYCKGFDA